MAQALSRYSIETENMVLLTFTDGSSKRVPLARIDEILAQPDAERVRQGLTIRQSFLHRHMPRFFILALAGSLAAVGLMTNQHQWAQLLHLNPTVTKATPVQTETVPVSSTKQVTSPASASAAVTPMPTSTPATVSTIPVSSQPVSSPAQQKTPVEPTVTKTVNQTVQQTVQQVVHPVTKTVSKLIGGLGL